MKLAIDASVVSSKRLAIFIWLLATAACIAGWPTHTLTGRLILGTTAAIVGAALAVQRSWLVRHPAHEVLLQIQSTLQASCIEYDGSDRSVRVISTGTRARVRGWGPFSLVSFDVLDSQCKKERFLLEVLTKYLRFIGKKDTHG